MRWIGRRRAVVALVVVAFAAGATFTAIASLHTAPDAAGSTGSGGAGDTGAFFTATGGDGSRLGPSEITAAFYRPQQTRDLLPTDYAGPVVRDTSRQVQTGKAYGNGYGEAVRVYVARSSTSTDLCLITTIATKTLGSACYPRSVVLDSYLNVSLGTGDRARRMLVDRGDVTFG